MSVSLELSSIQCLVVCTFVKSLTDNMTPDNMTIALYDILSDKHYISKSATASRMLANGFALANVEITYLLENLIQCTGKCRWIQMFII